MPERRSDGPPRSAPVGPVGRVKADSRDSGSAQALALTRPTGVDHTPIKRSRLTDNTVAHPALRATFSRSEKGCPSVASRSLLRVVSLALMALVLATMAVAALALALTFPTLDGRVVDEAGIIPEPLRAALTEKLKILEDKSGIQLVVATVNSLQGEEIEPFANELFRHWQLGAKEKNNGVLLLVAPKQRRVRIEVGYGLEGTLTDALSKIIITNAMAPRFKAGDFGGGIERGVDDVITVLTTDASEWQKRPELRVDRHDTTADNWAPWIAFALFLLVVFLLIRAPRFAARAPVSGGRAPYGRRGPGPIGGTPPGSGGGTGPTDPRARRSGWGDFLATLLWALLTSRRDGGGGGGWSSGSGGFGDSGGGFSGGGGSSGGGGASGSW